MIDVTPPGNIPQDPPKLRVTRKWAKEHGACHQAVFHFFRRYPNGLTLTRKNLLRAAETMSSRSLAWFSNEWEFWEIGEEHLETVHWFTRSVRRKREWANALADALDLP